MPRRVRPRTRSSAADVLLVQDPAEHRPHPDALVELERARRVLGVDAEADARLAAIAELPERVAKERAAHAPRAPRPPREEHGDPAAAEKGALARRPPPPPVARAHDPPQRRVEPRGLDVNRAPPDEL